MSTAEHAAERRPAGAGWQVRSIVETEPNDAIARMSAEIGAKIVESDGLVAVRATVPNEWIDINGHMNAGYFAVAVHSAMSAAYEAWGYGATRRAALGRKMFVLEKHVSYFAELKRGQEFLIRVRMIDMDEKRVIALLEYRDGEGTMACAVEMLMMGIDSNGRPAPFDEDSRSSLASVLSRHRELSLPSAVYPRLSLRRRDAQASRQ